MIVYGGGGGSNFWTALGVNLSPDSAQGYSNVLLASAGLFMWNSDLTLARLAAASMRQGAAPSATPVAQTFTLGEASRPGTDTDTGGGNGTIRPGLGTGTGTPSHLLLQGVSAAGSGTGAQSYATYVDIGGGVVLIDAVLRFVSGGQFSTGGGIYGSYFSSVGGVIASDLTFGWSSSTNAAAAAADVAFARLAAASLRQGLAPSATPVNQTFTIGEASRGGTDLNVAGANGTIRSGLGTGNAPGSSLLFQTPDVGASGTVAQTYATRLTINAQNTTFDLPNQGLRINGQTSGAGVSLGTLTNAPSAGDPSFWLPISIAGNIRYIPCWT